MGQKRLGSDKTWPELSYEVENFWKKNRNFFSIFLVLWIFPIFRKNLQKMTEIHLFFICFVLGSKVTYILTLLIKLVRNKWFLPYILRKIVPICHITPKLLMVELWVHRARTQDQYRTHPLASCPVKKMFLRIAIKFVSNNLLPPAFLDS